MLRRAPLILFFALAQISAATIPGDAVIRQMQERGAEAAEELSRSYGIDGFTDDLFHKDEPLLALAVQSGNIKAVRWFLDHGAKIDGHDGRGMPLWFAAFRRDLPMVRLLIQRGARPKEISGRVHMLESAVRSDHLELTKVLLEHGAPADPRLVLVSCSDSATAMTRYLLTKIEITPDGMTRCLDAALEKDKFETVQFLFLEKNTGLSDATIFIALASVIQRKSALDQKLLEKIVARTPNINALDTVYFHYLPKEDYGFNFQAKTALMIAAHSNRTDLIQLLLTRKPDLNIRTERKQTALHFAVFRCHNETIELLLEHKAAINTDDIFEKTPLNYAEENCPREIIVRLERAGAQKTIFTRGTKKKIRNALFYYGIPVAYTALAITMREGVYKDNPQDNWFGRVSGPLATAFLLGPLPAFILAESKAFGLLGGVLAPYVAVIGGLAGLTLGLVYNERFNDNRGIYYATVAPIYSFTLAQFFF